MSLSISFTPRSAKESAEVNRVYEEAPGGLFAGIPCFPVTAVNDVRPHDLSALVSRLLKGFANIVDRCEKPLAGFHLPDEGVRHRIEFGVLNALSPNLDFYISSIVTQERKWKHGIHCYTGAQMEARKLSTSGTRFRWVHIQDRKVETLQY